MQSKDNLCYNWKWLKFYCFFFFNRDRIKLLQSENERLDQSFNTYLKQQSSQAVNIQKDVSAVWASYNVDRLLLEKRRHQEQEAPPNQPEQRAKLVVPDTRVDECKSNLEVGQLSRQNKTLQAVVVGNGGEDISVPSIGKESRNNSSGEFSNPFINFDVKKFLESTTKHDKEKDLGREKEEEGHQSMNATTTQ